MHKPNVTVAAVVQYQDQFLFVEEKDKSLGNLVINQPAGHLELNETLIEACQRELFEETGLQLNPSGFIGTYRHLANNGTDYLRFCFYFKLEELSPLKPNDPDIVRAFWATLAQIEQSVFRSPLVLRCILDSQSRPLIALEYICG